MEKQVNEKAHLEKVFLLDDDDQSNFIFEEELRDSQIPAEIIIENNGWQALKYLNECESQNKFPDFVFVDLKMPKMDGFEFIRYFEIRFSKKFPQTKVIVLTNSSNPKDREKVLENSIVTGFLQKPVTSAILKNLITV